MKLIYIAGRFNPTAEEMEKINRYYYDKQQAIDEIIENNIRTATKASVELIEVSQGRYSPVSPHNMTAEIYRMNAARYPDSFAAKPDAEYWYKFSIEVLKRCDGVIFLHGWQESRGCNEEYSFAQHNHIPSFHQENYTVIRPKDDYSMQDIVQQMDHVFEQEEQKAEEKQ